MSQAEAINVLGDKARIDGLPPNEATKTITSAYSQPAREPARGSDGGAPVRPRIYSHTYRRPTISGLPSPMQDPARTTVRKLFRRGERIYVSEARDGRPAVNHVYSREQWLDSLDRHNGRWPYTDAGGAYVAINPIQGDRRKADEVSDYRHALLEFDDGPLEDQWALIRRLEIPCAAVISSAGKSLHAWVQVNATDHAEFKERVERLYEFVDENSDGEVRIDPANKDASRLSRLPGAVRNGREQSLIATDIGVESWLAFERVLQQRTLPDAIMPNALLMYDVKSDPNTILGDRWLCKGGSCMWVGPSGVGKSVLLMQASMRWAVGEDFFGIKPVRPLKSVVLQAENDMGDLADAFQGVHAALQQAGQSVDIGDRMRFYTESTWTGEVFARQVELLIERDKPDLIWVDPLMAYSGGDLSKQEHVSWFCRNLLNPISVAHGVTWMVVHHTPKPPKEQADQAFSDMAYKGFGSVELVNWARAVVVLSPVKHQTNNLFRLDFPKRGKKTGLPEPTLWLEHSHTRVAWRESQHRPGDDQTGEDTPKYKRGGRPSKIDDEMIRKVRDMRTMGISVASIAEGLRVSTSTVKRILSDEKGSE